MAYFDLFKPPTVLFTEHDQTNVQNSLLIMTK